MPELVQNPEGLTEIRPSKERRHVFNDYTPPTLPRSNRPFRKRKISTFNIILSLFLIAIVSVLYVSNIIAVNRLVVEIEELKTAYNKTENLNEILRSEINRKSRMERITKIASEQMGMMFPKQPPSWFELDEESLKKPEQ